MWPVVALKMSGLGESWSPGALRTFKQLFLERLLQREEQGSQTPGNSWLPYPQASSGHKMPVGFLQYTAQETGTTMKATEEKELS